MPKKLSLSLLRWGYYSPYQAEMKRKFDVKYRKESRYLKIMLAISVIVAVVLIITLN